MDINPEHTFERFIVGPENREAYEGIRRIVQQGHGAYQRVFSIHAGVGLGKTHVLHALFQELTAQDGGMQVQYVPSNSLLGNGGREPQKEYGKSDAVLIDDAHLLKRSKRVHEHMNGVMRELYGKGKLVVVTTQPTPREVRGVEELVLNLDQVAYRMKPPGWETRCNMLKEFARRIFNQELPDDVAEYFARRGEGITDMRMMRGMVVQFYGHTSLMDAPQTIETAKVVVPDALCTNKMLGSIDAVVPAVCEALGVKREEMQSAQRGQRIVRARHIAMFLAKRFTPYSLEEIGSFFGGRDHSTVLYGIERVERAMKASREIREEVEGLEKRLRGINVE